MNILSKIKIEAAKIARGGFSPSDFLSEEEGKWYFYLIIPALCYIFFFWQIGLDKMQTFSATATSTFFACLAGTLAAVLLTFFFSFVIKISCIITHIEINLTRLISTISVACFFPTIICFLGLMTNLIFKINTSLTFGLVGILFEFLFLYDIILTLEIGGIKKRKPASVLSVTVLMILNMSICSILMLI